METRTNHVNTSGFVPAEEILSKTGYTMATIADRATAIADKTIVAKNSAGKLVPLSDATAIDGTQIPVGILRGTIPAADISADDVENVELYISGKFFDEAYLVLENSLTLNSEIFVDSFPAEVSEDDAVEIATIESADATAEASAVTLVNEIKSALNAYTSAAKTSTLVNAIKSSVNTKTTGRKMTIREYLNLIGIFTRTVDTVTGYES